MPNTLAHVEQAEDTRPLLVEESTPSESKSPQSNDNNTLRNTIMNKMLFTRMLYNYLHTSKKQSTEVY